MAKMNQQKFKGFDGYFSTKFNLDASTWMKISRPRQGVQCAGGDPLRLLRVLGHVLGQGCYCIW